MPVQPVPGACPLFSRNNRKGGATRGGDELGRRRQEMASQSKEMSGYIRNQQTQNLVFFFFLITQEATKRF